MRTRTAKILVVALLVASMPPYDALAQSDATTASATVSGHVTSRGKPVVGVTVVLAQSMADWSKDSTIRAKTDSEGAFRLSGVKAGVYYIKPFLPAHVFVGSEESDEGRQLSVGPGDEIDGIELKVVPGGVITGTVKGEDGEPLVSTMLSFWRIYEHGNRYGFAPLTGWQGQRTDDRGVYRCFGLPPGRYVVGAGDNAERGYMSGSTAREMRYWPDSERPEEAGVIEVVGGDEHRADIKLGAESATFNASGRVVDADGGGPIVEAVVAFGPITVENARMQYMTGYTDINARGEFRSRPMRPGRYGVSVRSRIGSQGYYVEPMTFEVVDRDVTGIEIRVRRGATVDGAIAFESVPDDVRAAALSQLYISLQRVDDDDQPLGSPYGQAEQNGSFRIGGLKAGRYRVHMGAWPVMPTISLARVERDGIAVAEIEIAETETVANVRLVVVYATGIVRGSVLAGEDLAGADVSGTEVSLVPSGGDRARSRTSSTDERGGFLFEGVAPGQYDVEIDGQRLANGATVMLDSDTKTVSVTNGAVVEVRLVLRRAKQGGE